MQAKPALSYIYVHWKNCSITLRLSCSCAAVARAWGASASPLPAMSAKDAIRASVRSQWPIISWRYGPNRPPASLLPSPTIPLIAAWPGRHTKALPQLDVQCCWMLHALLKTCKYYMFYFGYVAFLKILISIFCYGETEKRMLHFVLHAQYLQCCSFIFSKTCRQQHAVSRYLCSTVESHILPPKGSMRQNEKYIMIKLGHTNKHQKHPEQIIK